MAMRSRGHNLCRVKRPIHIRQKCMTAPAAHIRQSNVTVEVGQSTLGRAIMSLARIHVLIRIVAHRQNRCLPGKRVTAPHTRRRASIHRRPATTKDILHRIGIESVSNPRGLHCRQDLRVVCARLRGLCPISLRDISKRGRASSGNRNILFRWKSKGENNRGFWKVLTRRH